jgi:hypothetical protein
MPRFKLVFVCLLLAWACRSVYAQPMNDICSSAIDLQNYLNDPGELAGPFSNVGATGNDLDIASVTGCWLDDLTGNADGSSPQIDATVWFRIEGFDGSLELYAQSCDSLISFLTEDTQMALYSGECDSLEIVACNEDVNTSMNNYWSGITAEIQSGVTYYLAVDGFNYSGFGSPELPLTTGEFCISFQEPLVSVEQPSEHILRLFPNPTAGLVSLKCDFAIEEIVITDLAGKTHLALANVSFLKTMSIELPIESGIYLLHVKTEQGNYMQRIVRY